MISIREGPKRDAIAKLRACRLPPILFYEWLGELKQGLRDGTIKLKNVRHDHGDWCQQHAERREADGRRFDVIWDLDTIEATGELSLMEFGCAEHYPDTRRDPAPPSGT
jgi:hypothetical protein